MAALHTYLENYPWTTSETDHTPTAVFADFYTTMETALDRFFPLSQVTIRDKDPPYMTPYIKYQKRCKLLRKHRFEKATTIAARINKAISLKNSESFVGLERGSRRLWTEVRRLRDGDNPGMVSANIGSITASSLNLHYMNISTDPDYVPPPA